MNKVILKAFKFRRMPSVEIKIKSKPKSKSNSTNERASPSPFRCTTTTPPNIITPTKKIFSWQGPCPKCICRCK